ncbi:hypothetical protein P43SY_001928 [Pythium insidiosum]|uniref:Uncharacterized protein n=1 Tax=Pythium insidiosum TaxID=114742 RepID=A0AAD5LT44_PYTIN|nr:hypothetical protein P43SY_001928 [Pythium insidiosum]
MSFLLGDAYAASSSSDSGSGSGSDDGGEGVAPPSATSDDSAAPAESQGLPSAADVLDSAFATSVPVAVPHRTDHDSIRVFDRYAEEQQEKQRALQQQQRHATSDLASAPSRRPLKRPAEQQEAGARLAAKRERSTVKDRVKGQRQRGQAGIGADFRAWKSETEMHLRQQFD